MGFDFVEKYGIFVMPLFFVASGYTVSPDKYSFGEYTKKRFQRILIPFWTATAVYYGPYGVLSVLLTFVGGAGSVLFILMLCQLLEKSPLRVVKKVLADIGNQSMDIYLWHFLIVFVLDAVAVAVFGAKLSPDIYYMELFTSGHVLYRIFKILVVFGVLTYGLPAIKKRIQKK